MLNTILDTSEWEEAGDVGQAHDSGIVAIITKATQGKDFVDHSLAKFAEETLSRDMLFGAYHFGSNTEKGEEQATWFLQHVAQVADLRSTLLCLDWEPGGGHSPTMSHENAERFAVKVRLYTGRWPFLYVDRDFMVHRVVAGDILTLCPLWLADYSEVLAPVPHFDRVTLRQYTDGRYGPQDLAKFPRSTPGFGKCDRNEFDGSFDELRAAWTASAVQTGNL